MRSDAEWERHFAQLQKDLLRRYAASGKPLPTGQHDGGLPAHIVRELQEIGDVINQYGVEYDLLDDAVVDEFAKFVAYLTRNATLPGMRSGPILAALLEMREAAL